MIAAIGLAVIDYEWQFLEIPVILGSVSGFYWGYLTKAGENQSSG